MKRWCDAGDVMQEGFTLVELMVGILIALVILGGLLYSFINQNSEYNYQNKRVDVAQDLEFGGNFMIGDIRASLFSEGGDPAANVAIVNGAGTNPPTVGVSFKVWDETVGAVNNRARRCYLYRNKRLYYKRDIGTGTCDVTTALTGFSPILENVTFFRVFQDVPGAIPSLGTITPQGAPKGLAFASGLDSTGNLVTNIPSYTLLIEMAVDVGYKKGSFKDVKGIDVRLTTDKRKRIWRYFQARPGTVVQ